MKTIFFTASELSVARYLLRAGVLADLIRAQIRVVLLVPEESRTAYQEEFSHELVVVEGIFSRQPAFAERILSFIANNAFKTKTTRWVQYEQYFLDKSRLKFLLRSIVRYVLAWLPYISGAVRLVDRRVKGDRHLAELFSKYKPDLVFATILFMEMDLEAAREAKKRGIRLIGMIRSWDNLTTYGYIRVIPDLFLAQNKFIARMAKEYQEFPEEIIRIVGTPLYDSYIGKDMLVPREEFLGRLGLSPNAKIALYGAMGTFLFSEEERLIDLFETLSKNGDVSSALRFIYRTHPAFPVQQKEGGNLKATLIDHAGSASVLSGWRKDMRESDEAWYVNSLSHADVVITAASTVGLEAMMFDRPTVILGFDLVPVNSAARSAEGFQKLFTHYREFVQMGGVQMTHNKKELAEAINESLSDPDRLKEGRKKAKDEFLEPLDGKSSGRVSRIILEMLKIPEAE